MAQRLEHVPPTKWPWFTSQRQPLYYLCKCMWVEFVVGSPLCSERFFSRYFLLKNYKISKLQSNMDQADEKQQVEALSLNHCLLLLFYFNLVRG